ncbi:MAG TPA: DUF4127 family protein [Bacilli bacterium]|nr:MAG: hypothetical protein BWY97_01216 [Tenericutes bacterium ADurb.BinA124]HNZ50530.1 DUF4127 family protein [Bacilli bacterium]HOH17961.1 DUF4127 family protein [Bacilli bacterium]HPX83668.1 DUF4127 family protein [Bacilli bacterium]HQC74261.1 DUF4127 family protein [Bacilli bacterium]
MKTNIGLIPLDSRPCNYDWPLTLSKLANVNLITLDKSCLGTLHTKLDFAHIQSFLDEKLDCLHFLICPLDSIISGGLIQSRKANFSHDELNYKINYLKTLKKRNPKLKIYVFDTILRTSISTFDEKTKQYWQLINEYSRYKGQYLRFHKQEDYDEFQKISLQIPVEVLNTYEVARLKKHEVNQLALDLLQQKAIDFLLLLQEDSMPKGLQTLEHDVLNKIIQHKHLENKAWLYNGADEGSCFLLAKIISDIHEQPLKYYLLHPDEALLALPQAFEDRPYLENLSKMTKILQMQRTDDLKEAAFVLAIYQNNPLPKMEIADREQALKMVNDDKTRAFINHINMLLKQTIPVFFLDINVPNGGCWELLKQIDFLKLKAYSAWNTASNSTGSLLATAAIYCLQAKPDPSLTNLFLQERIIDDCFYQDVVRGKIHEYLRTNLLNLFDFKPHHEVKQLLQRELHALSDPFFKTVYRAYFPWNRAFEIGISYD